MARNIFGYRKITKEDMYTKRVIDHKSEIRWICVKAFMGLCLGIIYLWFIVLGRTI